MLRKNGLVTESPNIFKHDSSKESKLVTFSRNLQKLMWKDDIFYKITGSSWGKYLILLCLVSHH